MGIAPFYNVTVPFSTEEGFPKVDNTFRGTNVIWKCRCAYGDAQLLADQLATYPDDYISFNGAPGTYLIRSLIDPAPYLRITGVSGQEGMADYEQAVITNYYTNINTFRGRNNCVAQVTIVPSATHMPVNAWALRWQNGGKLVVPDEVGTLRNPMVMFKLRYLRASSVPSGYLTLPGYCNSAPYTNTFLGVTFPAQTLLYEAGPLQIGTGVTGLPQIDVTQICHFAYNGGNGWNYFWRAETGQWEQQKILLGPTYIPYPPGNFSQL